MQYTDVKPGMWIKGYGIVSQVEGSFCYFDVDDCYIGDACLSAPRPGDYIEVHPMGSKEYLAGLRKVMDQRREAITNAHNDLDLLKTFDFIRIKPGESIEL